MVPYTMFISLNVSEFSFNVTLGLVNRNWFSLKALMIINTLDILVSVVSANYGIILKTVYATSQIQFTYYPIHQRLYNYELLNKPLKFGSFLIPNPSPHPPLPPATNKKSYLYLFQESVNFKVV